MISSAIYEFKPPLLLVFLLSLTELPGTKFFAKGQLKRPAALQLVLGNAQLNYARAEAERVKGLREAGVDLLVCGA